MWWCTLTFVLLSTCSSITSFLLLTLFDWWESTFEWWESIFYWEFEHFRALELRDHGTWPWSTWAVRPWKHATTVSFTFPFLIFVCWKLNPWFSIFFLCFWSSWCSVVWRSNPNTLFPSQWFSVFLKFLVFVVCFWWCRDARSLLCYWALGVVLLPIFFLTLFDLRGWYPTLIVMFSRVGFNFSLHI